MNSSEAIHVALAGDHPLNLHALAALFDPAEGIHVVSISGNIRALRRSLENPPGNSYPQIVVVDLNFELHPVIDIIDFLRYAHPKIRLIVLGLTRDQEAVARLLQRGANRYLGKNITPETLAQAIRDQGRPSFEQEVTRPNSSTEDPSHAPWPVITEKEYRYFRLAISDVSNDDIRRELKIDRKSYEQFVAHIYRRFNVRSRDGLAIALFKRRWLVRDDL